MRRHSFLSLAPIMIPGMLAGIGSAQDAGDAGGAGLALKAAKILTASWDGPQVVDTGVVLVKDGKIEAVGRARELEIPAGYEVVDVGERWLAPGITWTKWVRVGG